jgi:DNA-binding LacI/PurR family transcriptional regulator
MSNGQRSVTGRSSSGLAAKLRQAITGGDIAPGSFLPTERGLAQENGIAPVTARRALKILEAEGLVSAEPRKGYRVTPRASDPQRGAPLAFVLAPHRGTETWDSLHIEKLAALQKSANQRGWGFIAVGTEGYNCAQIMEQLRGASVLGAIIDAKDPGLFEAARDEGLPILAIDEWRDDLEVDAVVQDGFRGGLVAARYLLECGCRRIGWLGPMGTGFQSLERYGGAFSYFDSLEKDFEISGRWRLPFPDDPQGVAVAKDLLSSSDRPDGILSLWQGCTRSLVQAARELGLTPGKDFKMVGWCTEGEYESFFLKQFAGGPVPAAVSWDVAEMANTAVSRLAERRSNVGLSAIKIKVPVRLHIHES